MTSSVMTRRSRRFASVMNLRKSRMRAEVGIDAPIVGDVVAVVLAGTRIERQQPQRVDAEVLEIIELLGQAGEIADAVAVAVGERLDVKLVDDGVLVPQVVAAIFGWTSICGSTFTAYPLSSFAAEQQGRVVGRIDGQAHAAPFDHVPLAGRRD